LNRIRLDKESLKKKFILGNKKAFDKIYHDFSAAMYTICLRYTNNADEAADILQDAFIRIYEKRKRFDPTYNLGGWIKRIVINEAINHYRSNKKYEFVESDSYFEDENEEMEITFHESEEVPLADVLKKILRELPEGYRAIFNMYVFDNLKHTEISEYLGISVNTSKSQLSKARKMIRTKLEAKNITRSSLANG